MSTEHAAGTAAPSNGHGLTDKQRLAAELAATRQRLANAQMALIVLIRRGLANATGGHATILLASELAALDGNEWNIVEAQDPETRAITLTVTGRPRTAQPFAMPQLVR